MIDYHLLAKAKDYYESQGFDYIEVDWLIPVGISDITKPVESQSVIVTPDKLSLLVSGEQEFLYHIHKGNLPKSGTYQTIIVKHHSKTLREFESGHRTPKNN